MLECSKRLPGHAEKLYTLLNTNAHDCMYLPGILECANCNKSKKRHVHNWVSLFGLTTMKSDLCQFFVKKARCTRRAKA